MAGLFLFSGTPHITYESNGGGTLRWADDASRESSRKLA